MTEEEEYELSRKIGAKHGAGTSRQNVSDEDYYEEEFIERKDWKSYREVQDIRNGIARLDVNYEKHPSLKHSIFSNWKELYSYCTRLCRDDSTLPSHFKNNAAAMMIVMQRGEEMGIEPMDAIYSIIPMKGYLCVLGDKMHEWIMDSGKCSQWEEEESGSFGKGNYKYKITVKRADTGQGKSITFGMDEMKRAKLYISPEMYDQVKGGLTKGQEIRYRYPQRLCKYVAMGWIMRDIFPEITRGLRVMEEVETYDDYEKVLREDGTEIAGKPMKHVASAQRRNEKLLSTMQIAGDLDRDADGRLKKISEHPDNLSNIEDTKLFSLEGRILEKDHYTEDEIYSLKGARAKHLNAVMAIRGIISDYLPKLSVDQKRQIILEHQKGWKEFKLYIAEEFGKDASHLYDDSLRETKPEEKKIHTAARDIEAEPQNKFNIRVPEVDKVTSERSLEDALDLKAAIENYVVDNEKQFMKLIAERRKHDGRPYTGMLDYCRNAWTKDVNRFLGKMYK